MIAPGGRRDTVCRGIHLALFVSKRQNTRRDTDEFQKRHLAVSAPDDATTRWRCAALSGLLPDRVFAQTRKDTLVLGIDISDTITLDPARLAQYTSPMTVSAAYDSLVTMTPGEYINVAPALATKWARTPDGKGWRFTLRDGVKVLHRQRHDGGGRQVVVRPRHQSRRPALAIHRARRPRRDRRQDRPSTSS